MQPGILDNEPGVLRHRRQGGDRGTLALAQAADMAGWVRLEHLLLKNNGISKVGAGAIAFCPRFARHSRRGKEYDTDKGKDQDRAPDKVRETALMKQRGAGAIWRCTHASAGQDALEPCRLHL